MTKDEAKKLPKSTIHPLLARLPDYLKDRANYEKVMRAILDVGATRHSHGEITEWAACAHCQKKETDRLMFMKKLGFVNAAQFKMWQKTHQEIKKRYPLVDWTK